MPDVAISWKEWEEKSFYRKLRIQKQFGEQNNLKNKRLDELVSNIKNIAEKIIGNNQDNIEKLLFKFIEQHGYPENFSSRDLYIEELYVFFFVENIELSNYQLNEIVTGIEKFYEKIILQERHKDKLIKEFVSQFINENNYPEDIDITENDIKALDIILKEENVQLSLKDLKEIVLTEFFIQYTDNFQRLFFRDNPCLLNCNELEHWIKAYVNSFGNTLHCIDYFVYILQANTNYRFNDNDYLVLFGLIQKELEESHLKELAKTYKNNMLNGQKCSKILSIKDIDDMQGLEFEQVLGKLFSKMGYKTEITQASGDQGADLIIEKMGKRTAVQAKCFANVVSNKAIQEIVAAKAHYNCQGTMVVTNNYFTKSAIELAMSNNVELWDRETLEENLRLYPVYE